jgi:hypothetical protein
MLAPGMSLPAVRAAPLLSWVTTGFRLPAGVASGVLQEAKAGMATGSQTALMAALLAAERVRVEVLSNLTVVMVEGLKVLVTRTWAGVLMRNVDWLEARSFGTSGSIIDQR